MALTWRACKPVAACNAASVSAGDVTRLFDAIQEEEPQCVPAAPERVAEPERVFDLDCVDPEVGPPPALTTPRPQRLGSQTKMGMSRVVRSRYSA